VADRRPFKSLLGVSQHAAVFKTLTTSPATPLTFGIDGDDDHDDSDILSDVFDISIDEAEEQIENEKEEAGMKQNMAPPLLNMSLQEDEFVDGKPWNAVVVVGLRVYSNESQVEVKVVRSDW